MSLINQVLNELERRGAHAAPDQTMVRAVPPRRESHWGRTGLLAGVMLAVLGLVLWQAGGGHKRTSETETSGRSTPQQTVQSAVPVKAEPPSMQQPASRLSFELSMLPLPDTLNMADQDTAKATPLVPGLASAEVPPTANANPPQPRPRASVEAKPESQPPFKLISPQQRADAQYRAGLQAQQAGRVPEALAAFETALKTDERHQTARLALAALLFDNGQAPAAERVLQTGLTLKPVSLVFAMALARMQVERKQLAQAVKTLQARLPQADDNADYQAFYAALLQRQQRHKEALNHYELALRLRPRNGVWLMGYGISLQAVDRKEDAGRVYRQALATQTLSPELSAFVQQKLEALVQAEQGR